MSDSILCPKCKHFKNRQLFTDGVCNECASTLDDVLSTKPVDYAAQTQQEAQQEAELEYRLQAELDRAKQEREEAFNAEQEARKELARREAARRNLLPFVMYFNEDYMPGWVHADICRRLEQFSKDVADKKSPRLMLFLPPRSGKSEIASKTFPAWHLGHHPNHDIIGCSYSSALAIDFSRKVRGLVQDERYHNIFDTRMDESSQSAERWNTSAGGGYVAAGVQGPITGRGAHCFPAGTSVTMSDGSLKNIEDVCIGDTVLSYDFSKHRYTSGKVIARQVKNENRFTQVRTASGKLSRATTTHRFYITSMGWTQARYLKEGHEVIVAPYNYPLCAMPQGCDQNTCGGGEISKTRSLECHVFPTVQRNASKAGLFSKMSDLWKTYRASSKILFTCLHPIETVIGRPLLSSLFDRVQTCEREINVLLTYVRQSSTFSAYAWGEQLQLSTWAGAPCFVQEDKTSCEREGWQQMRGMRCNAQVTRTPQGREQVQRFDGELSDIMSFMPHDTPQVTYDTISSVATIEAEPEPVYDIQVQGTECFFADGILVHNCAIIDDPIKDRDSAESETIRQSIKDWYSSTFYTRLAPGGGVLVIMTRWHEDDLSGWLLKCMQEAEQEAAESGEWPEDADRWEVVRYPAIATHDEPYRKAGEALHPARYGLKALMKIKRTLIPRDWEALYQQNPTSADGDYFKKEYFRMYDSAPPLDTLRVYAAWDLAIGKKESNDYTCGIVVGVDRSNDIWVLHRYYGRFDAKELIEKFFECQETWKPTLQGIEHGQIEMTLEPFILKEMTESGRSLNYIKLKTRGNDKMTRARPIQGRMQQMRVHFPSGASWFQELQNEMLAFPSGKHDDQVDAMAWVGQMILMMSPNREKAPPPKKSWRDSLRKQIHSTQGYGLSHMAS